jgi:hypothetical protein
MAAPQSQEIAMQQSITVQGKVIGQSRPSFPDWAVPLPPEVSGSGSVTLRDLITRIVLAEVGAFKAQQQERRLTRVLSREAIEQAALRGKVTMGGQDLEQAVDPQAAVATALLAFEDGLYFVFVDDVQGETLDQPVRVQPGSEVLFLRLVPLAGG